MLKYAIVEISGKQYSISPGETLVVDYLGEIKKFECDKILLLARDGKLEIGKPYLKEKLTLEVLGNQKRKIRVATYKPKVNYRRVIGAKNLRSLVKLTSWLKKS